MPIADDPRTWLPMYRPKPPEPGAGAEAWREWAEQVAGALPGDVEVTSLPDQDDAGSMPDDFGCC